MRWVYTRAFSRNRPYTNKNLRSLVWSKKNHIWSVLKWGIKRVDFISEEILKIFKNLYFVFNFLLMHQNYEAIGEACDHIGIVWYNFQYAVNFFWSLAHYDKFFGVTDQSNHDVTVTSGPFWTDTWLHKIEPQGSKKWKPLKVNRISNNDNK